MFCVHVAFNFITEWFQTFHQIQVGLMEDNLGQVFLPFDLFLHSVRDVRDHVGQEELGEVNDVLRGEGKE